MPAPLIDACQNSCGAPASSRLARVVHPAGWKPALRVCSEPSRLEAGAPGVQAALPCGKIACDTFTYTSIARGGMALRCSGIVKRFGHIRALSGADLFVRDG